MVQASSLVLPLGIADASLHSSGHRDCDKKSKDVLSLIHASKTGYHPSDLDHNAEVTNFKHSGSDSEFSSNVNLEQYSPLHRNCTKDAPHLVPFKHLEQFSLNQNDNVVLLTKSLHNQTCLLASGFQHNCLETNAVQTEDIHLYCESSRIIHAHRHKKNNSSMNIHNLLSSPNQTHGSLDGVSHCRTISDPLPRFNAVFSITSSLILLLALFQPPIAMATQISAKDFHPSQVLSSSSPMPSNEASESSSGNRISSQGAGLAADEVKEDEVLHHLYRNGGNSADFRKPSVTFMVELFNDLQRGGTLGYSNRVEPVTDTVRSFSGENSRKSRKGKRTVNFHVPYLPQHETLRAAEIRFLRSPTQKKAFRRFRFRIDIRARGKIVNKFTFRENAKAQYEYNVFDVTSIVRPWINSHHGNMSLHIRVSRKLRNHLLMPSKDNQSQSTSLIVLYLEDKEFLKNMYASFTKADEKSTDDESESSTSLSESSSSSSPKSRAKRTVAESMSVSAVEDKSFPSGNSTRHALLSRSSRGTRIRRLRNRKSKNRRYRPMRRENCQVYDFHVDFTVIGWGEWIIHPKRFNSKFCFGQCPSPIEAKYHPTNHAMLQTLMRMKLPNVAPSPCCVPTKLKAVSMLYVEYDEIVVRSHEDMIVDQCGCR
ncbi:hypothetical protein EGW08_018985 [Elysia chlorotica]|uniref:TGF-beta family profile domain-containing protein n=1 Tax=Elysia chlorotica TaxID=188477 RepID=A0A433SVF6_ELYCH|nr:hypothetical protein EGW08_018985 [Elysia chlorotica]